MWGDKMKQIQQFSTQKRNDIDLLLIAVLLTFLFYALIWIFFWFGLNNPVHRIFILLGGALPLGLVQFFTFLAFFWALIILNAKKRKLALEQKALSLKILPEDEHTVILPEKINDIRLELTEMTKWRDSILVNTLIVACTKFRANYSVQETMDIVKIQSEIYESYLNSSFGIVRYLAWSIPSIGFIGTVLGISGALAKVDEAVAGNIESVTAMLGTAFDTTLIALALSILLMFQIHRTQQLEETFIVNVQDYILKNFVNRIYIPKVK
jgi:biopolymer transport protein ExbB/TolQ